MSSSCTSRVALVLGRRSRAWRSNDTATRARASAVSPSPSTSIDRRSQNVESARRRRERREFGGVSFSILIFSFLDDDEKDRARRGDVVVVALDARACIFFDVSRTTRVKARRDARHALEGHSVLMSRGGVVGCAVLSCVRFKTKVSDARACVEKRSHLVVVALFVIVRVTNRASSEESDRTSSVLLSTQKQTRAFVCVVRIRTLGSTPRAYPRALGRCVRDHSSLSRGHRRCGREPLLSISTHRHFLRFFRFRR